MKNKKSTIGLMLLMAGSLVLTNCTKNKTNPAPEPDIEVASATEATNVQMILSDIHEIAAQVCETNSFLLGYQDGTPVTITSGTTTVISANAIVFADLFNEFFTVTFNNTVGKDGHIRNGVLKFDYSPTIVSTIDHYRLPSFIANVTSIGYSVDNYTVHIKSMTIKNTTPVGFPTTAPYFPAVTNLKFSQASDIRVLSNVSGLDTTITTFNGTINKEVLNTNNTSIPMPSGYPTTYTVATYPAFATLSVGKCYNAFTGEGTGTLADGSAYTFAITSPLTRNMISSPEVFASFNSMLLSTERHPFLTGIVSFKPGTKTVRSINYGTSGDVVDYNAKVTIDGITYDVDMK